MQIYRILNTKNKKSYIGLTKHDFNKRYKNGTWHKRTHSKPLKRAVEKYGLDSFEVEILENNVNDSETLYALERKYIKQYNSYIPNGYNLTKGGGSENPTSEKEYVLINKLGEIFKIKNLSQFCWNNKLNYGAMLNMVSGRNVSSQGYALEINGKDCISKREFKTHLIENIKTGEKHSIKPRNLKKWCLENSLTYSSIHRLIRGVTLKWKDWKMDGVDLPENYGKKTKYNLYLIDTKTNEEVLVDNIYKFCQERGFKRNGFYELANGRVLSAYGFKLKNPKKTHVNNSKIFKLFNIKTKESVISDNVSFFCRERGLNINDMFTMIGGTILVYKNWTVNDRDVSSYSPPKKISYMKVKNKGGVVIECESPQDLEKKYKLFAAMGIYNIINGKAKNEIKGWSIVNVKYMDDNYPELKFEEL